MTIFNESATEESRMVINTHAATLSSTQKHFLTKCVGFPVQDETNTDIWVNVRALRPKGVFQSWDILRFAYILTENLRA